MWNVLKCTDFRERERDKHWFFCCSPYLCTNWSILLCALIRNQTWNLGILDNTRTELPSQGSNMVSVLFISVSSVHSTVPGTWWWFSLKYIHLSHHTVSCVSTDKASVTMPTWVYHSMCEMISHGMFTNWYSSLLVRYMVQLIWVQMQAEPKRIGS